MINQFGNILNTFCNKKQVSQLQINDYQSKFRFLCENVVSNLIMLDLYQITSNSKCPRIDKFNIYLKLNTFTGQTHTEEEE